VVETSPRARFRGGCVGIFPAALEQPARLEATECLVESAVTDQSGGAVTVPKLLRNREPVDFGFVCHRQSERLDQDLDLDLDQLTGFPS
jgi:hypothetical protein